MVDDSGVEIILTGPAHASLTESLRRAPIVVDDVHRDGDPGPARDPIPGTSTWPTSSTRPGRPAGPRVCWWGTSRSPGTSTRSPNASA
ncbi:hypothetical protein NKG94_22100 [Micromonospora sp. M12]